MQTKRRNDEYTVRRAYCARNHFSLVATAIGRKRGFHAARDSFFFFSKISSEFQPKRLLIFMKIYIFVNVEWNGMWTVEPTSAHDQKAREKETILSIFKKIVSAWKIIN